ncbi:MAG: YhgE/Pip domain-containing protein [Erysipelotrichales bacterium]
MKVIKQEWKNILNSKVLIGSFLVICFIPILYASFFLKSIWDPYGKTQNLPVAVVNNDKAIEFNGKKMAVGDELEAKLREDKNLDWNFVDSNTAKDGLENNKYYMVLTLDENFSKNAASVLDAKPTKMKITYTTNGSMNYLGEVVGETAAKQLEKEVSSTVTRAYVETAFEQLKTAGSGFKQASDGASKLDDGASKINEGNNKLLANLNTLSQSTILFQNGTSKFNVGLSQYVNGINEVNKGAIKLNDGTTLLIKALPALTGGVNKLNDGGNTLNDSIIQYTAAVDQMDKGSSAIVSNNDKLKAGSNALNNNFQNISGLAQGSNSVLEGLKQASAALDTDNTTTAQELGSINARLQAISTNTSGAPLKNNSADINTIRTNIDDMKTKTFSSTTAINNVMANDSIKALDSETQKTIKDSLTSELSKYDYDLSGNIKQVKSALTNIENNTKVSALAADDSALQTAVNNIAIDANSTIPKANSTLVTTDAIKKNLDTKLIPGMTLVNGGIATLDGSKDQVAQLNQGINDYLDATAVLSTGLTTLNKNSAPLKAGSAQLSGGLNEINKKVPTLAGSAKQLNGGTAQLKDGTNKLVSNGSTLLNGGQTINETAIKFVDGSSQLYKGDALLADALNTLNDGTNTLSTKLGEGAKVVDKVKVSDDNAKMIASPDKLVHDKYTTVPNYGHALAPYVLSLALYVGCLVFNVIIPTRTSSAENIKVKDIWKSRVLLGLVAVVLMTVIEAGIMMLLGIDPVSTPKYLLIAFTSAFAYMFLIMFLAVAFENPGRFAAMILLILQLACSGGTFPIQLSGKFFNALHAWVPMTYSVNGFRDAISGGMGNGSYVASSLILVGIAALSMFLLYITIRRLRRKDMLDIPNPAANPVV